MNQILKFCLLSVISLNSEAGPKGHKAHSHGQGSISIAFDGQLGTLEFEAPSDSIWGQEHAPKTAKDKKIQADGLAKLEAEMPRMVSFTAPQKCTFTKTDIRAEFHGKHADAKATFQIRCEKPLEGTTLSFSFQASFPQLKQVEVQILAGAIQKGLRVDRDHQSLQLTP